MKKNNAITPRETDMSKWYSEICLKAELMSYSKVKGFIVYRPYGYAIWEQIQAFLDKEFKATGHQNVYMPLLIPQSLLEMEKEHVEGFAPECAVVTKGGDKELDSPLYIRPTSETLFCDHFKDILSSYRDLPIKYNQWCSVVRWEKTTRPFLRGSEFLWQEGHTLHRTADEAKEETLKMLKIYNKMGKDILAIPFVMGRKTDKEKFAGALETYTIEALMPDGQALQSGTSHYFGQGFAEHYGISYLDDDNVLKTPHQTSWGVSTRLIGSIIMEHGDDNGLVLPPYVAPTQVVLIPIRPADNPEVMKKLKDIKESLESKGIRVLLDDSNKSPGWKYAEYEMKGVPLRIDLGPKDIQQNHCMYARRFDGKKDFWSLDDDIAQNVIEELKQINKGMYNKALKYLLEHTVEVHSFEELKDVIENGKGYAKMMWCGDRSCEDEIKNKLNATARCIPFDQEPFDDKCPICGKKAKQVVLFARAY
ncbi:MAG: proline--tRNA ligase [Bacilli bacterium]